MGAEKTRPAFDLRESYQKVLVEALWARYNPVSKRIQSIKELGSPLRGFPEGLHAFRVQAGQGRTS